MEPGSGVTMISAYGQHRLRLEPRTSGGSFDESSVSCGAVSQTGPTVATVPALPLMWLTQAHDEPALPSDNDVPDLDELAGQWLSIRDLHNLPAVTSERGSLKVGMNVSSFQLASFPPLSQGGETLQLAIDGYSVLAEQSRWYPYQVSRRSTYADLAVDTSTRMLHDHDAILVKITVSNTAAQPRTLTLDLTASTWLRSFTPKWEWQLPRPTDATAYRATRYGVMGQPCVTIADSQSVAVSAHAFTTTPDSITIRDTEAIVSWQRTLEPRCSVIIGVVVAVGITVAAVNDDTIRLARNFNETFARARHEANSRFRAAFTPEDTTYSGHLPTLVTSDTELKRVYYSSIVSLLALQRSCFASASRIFSTAAPEWATSLTYFWDTSLWATVWAMLDPVMMRRQLLAWVKLGVNAGYAVDNLSQGLSGPWYAANDLSMFTLLRYYFDHTGDFEFLSEGVAGLTILQHMDAIASHWQSLVQPGQVLADYGEADNLLEAVPTYIHQVPSLNAANVWMMRRTAELHDRIGNALRARQLRELAAELAVEVLQLYIEGQGVWSCRQPNGTAVTVRHVYDYATIGEFMSEELTTTVRAEMQDFLHTELLHDGWMRAMSVLDPNAAASDRPDHGPHGAYDGWLAHSAAASATMGEHATALQILRQAATVTTEGPFSQAHEFVIESQGVLVFDRAELNPTTQITLEVWINARNWSTDLWGSSILSKDAWGPEDQGYVLRGGQGGRISFAVALKGVFHEVCTTARLDPDRWHHLVGTFNGSALSVYLDSAPSATMIATGTITSSTGTNLCIGAHPLDHSRMFDGIIESASIFPRALTASEITARYTSGPTAPASAPGPVLYLPLDEKHGSATTDAVTGVSCPVRAGQWVAGISGSALDFRPAMLGEGVRIAQRGGQDFNCSVSGSFAQTIIRDVYGFQPDGDAPALVNPTSDRGTEGVLENVAFAGHLYRITSDRNGLHMHLSGPG